VSCANKHCVNNSRCEFRLLAVPDSPAVASKVYNEAMFLSSISKRRFVTALLLAGLVSAVAFAQDADSPKRGRKYKAPPATSHVEVTVLRASNGKPVENAAVIFHPLEDGRNAGNMELKTNDEGKAVIDLLTTGSDVRLQIIASGFQTYGEDYKVDKDNMSIEVKLKRPAPQYSIYKKSEGAASSPDKSQDPPKDAAPKDAAPKDAAPDAKPDATPDPPKDDAKPQDSTAPPK
jgi:hypothetical protein